MGLKLAAASVAADSSVDAESGETPFAKVEDYRAAESPASQSLPLWTTSRLELPHGEEGGTLFPGGETSASTEAHHGFKVPEFGSHVESGHGTDFVASDPSEPHGKPWGPVTGLYEYVEQVKLGKAVVFNFDERGTWSSLLDRTAG
ncbi:MAG: hypothetical protein AB1646_25655 [Thermodesulfobacteriota bacterium]